MLTIIEILIKINDGGKNQNLILFIRGNAISGAPNINGTNQLANPPIIKGIIIKKIIKKAWAVITLLKKDMEIKSPGPDNSKRIIILKLKPTKPDQNPKIKYIIPISLWLVEHNQRIIKLKNFYKDAWKKGYHDKINYKIKLFFFINLIKEKNINI